MKKDLQRIKREIDNTFIPVPILEWAKLMGELGARRKLAELEKK